MKKTDSIAKCGNRVGQVLPTTPAWVVLVLGGAWCQCLCTPVVPVHTPTEDPAYRHTGQLEAGLKLEVKFQYSHGGGTVACHLLELPSVQLATLPRNVAQSTEVMPHASVIMPYIPLSFVISIGGPRPSPR